MPYTASHDSMDNLVLINYTGAVTFVEIKNCALEAMRLASEHKCQRFLIDGRTADFPLSIMDIYKYPDTLASMAQGMGLDIMRSKRAIVVSHIQSDHAFMEANAREKMQNVMVFDDIKPAKIWLSSD